MVSKSSHHFCTALILSSLSIVTMSFLISRNPFVFLSMATAESLPEQLENASALSPNAFSDENGPAILFPPDPDNWQTVVPDKIFVYSAHLDSWTIDKSIVHVLGTMENAEIHSPNRTELFCKLGIFVDDSRTPTVHMSEVSEIINRQPFMNRSYRDVEYLCRFNVTPESVSNAMVQIVTNGEEEANNAMKLHHNFKKGLHRNFTVCLERPLFGKISADWFVEWIEANVIFGAEKIIIHTMAISEYLNPYIDYYEKTGLLEVLPWDIDLSILNGTRDLTHMHLQMTMIYDCLYALQKYSKYIVYIDIDELIVPRSPSDRTWADMMGRLSCYPHSHSYGARQSAFTLRSRRRDNTTLMTLDVRDRNGEFLEYRSRSKYIADTFGVRKLSVHFAIDPANDSTCVMPPEIGALHHYKYVSEVRGMQDDTMLKYRDELLERVQRTKGRVKGSLEK